MDIDEMVEREVNIVGDRLFVAGVLHHADFGYYVLGKGCFVRFTKGQAISVEELDDHRVIVVIDVVTQQRP